MAKFTHIHSRPLGDDRYEVTAVLPGNNIKQTILQLTSDMDDDTLTQVIQDALRSASSVAPSPKPILFPKRLQTALDAIDV